MDKITKAVIRYEKARQLISDLNHKKSMLISECECCDTTEDNHGMIVHFGENCFVKAFADVTEKQDDDITYEDSFMSYINDEAGACDSCRDAYKIKHGALADAKKEFGNARRSLSYHGKRLIEKGEENGED